MICDVGKVIMMTKRKFILYLAGFFFVVQVAANIRHSDPALDEKILAFKNAGVEKEIDTARYDVDAIIYYAESLLGTRHVMGGCSPAGLDCSGLVKLAHSKLDIDLPHSSQEQARYGAIISSVQELKRGDLVFFHSTYSTVNLVTHSGIYLGDNKFIHTSTSRGVSISLMLDSGYWQNHYLFATRLKH